MDYFEKSLKLHKENKGKIAMVSKVSIKTREELATAYTPGVAEPCRKIHSNPQDVYQYTSKGNTIAIVSDGTAVLGLGDIGASASIPVMEGKAILFKEFANIDALPICIDSKDIDEIVNTIKIISTTFGGINLEDINAPRCFEIEERLKKELSIPVFHDDQHGTAIVCAAGMLNALRLVEKNIEDITIVVNGIGSAGTAIIKLLIKLGARNIIACDRDGILNHKISYTNEVHNEIARITNQNEKFGLLKDAMIDADVFIGVSAPNVVTADMISSMANNSIIFAMANPTPEIMPDVAIKAGARVVGTGRSDFPNQINNVLAFPGIFRGALDARAKDINEEMKLAAVYAIALLITDAELNEEYIIPDVFDKRVVERVSDEVIKAARKSGVARI